MKTIVTAVLLTTLAAGCNSIVPAKVDTYTTADGRVVTCERPGWPSTTIDYWKYNECMKDKPAAQ